MGPHHLKPESWITMDTSQALCLNHVCQAHHIKRV
uniref:Uncharacterized protein n=1 Tax=Arundo donax TaxID=35708 RepID=A0A0A9G1P3_ARUDO